MSSIFGCFKPIRISRSNYIPFATLSTENTAPLTSVDNLKNLRRSSTVTYNDIAQTGPAITADFGVQQIANYWAIPSISLPAGVIVVVTLFAGALDSATVYSSGFVVPADIIPIGDWAAGVDPYGGSLLHDGANALIQYIEPAVMFQSFRLQIYPLDHAGVIQLRSFMLGEYAAPEKNFTYSGNEFEPFIDPEIEVLTSGHNAIRRPMRESRSFTAPFSLMSDSDRYMFKQVLKLMNGQPMLIDPYPEETAPVYQECSFVGTAFAPRFSHYAYHLHRSSLSFVEI